MMAIKMTNLAATALGVTLAAMITFALARAIYPRAVVRAPQGHGTVGAAAPAVVPPAAPVRRRGGLACGSLRLNCDQLEMMLPE